MASCNYRPEDKEVPLPGVPFPPVSPTASAPLLALASQEEHLPIANICPQHYLTPASFPRSPGTTRLSWGCCTPYLTYLILLLPIFLGPVPAGLKGVSLHARAAVPGGLRILSNLVARCQSSSCCNTVTQVGLCLSGTTCSPLSHHHLPKKPATSILCYPPTFQLHTSQLFNLP